MSRVGNAPVKIPENVDVKIEDHLVTVKGPNGMLRKLLPVDMGIEFKDGQLFIKRPSEKKEHRALHGLTRALLNNMVKGVTEGFERKLEVAGVGYRAAKQGNKLVLTVGYSHPVELEPEEGVEVEVPTPTKIIVKGADKEKVGFFAATIRGVREPEHYKGKGIKYENETVRRKVGKAGGPK